MVESLLVLLLLLRPQKVCQAYAEECMGNVPIEIPHEWYQSGEVFIGGIVTHIYYTTSRCSFKQHPSRQQIHTLPL